MNLYGLSMSFKTRSSFRGSAPEAEWRLGLAFWTPSLSQTEAFSEVPLESPEGFEDMALNAQGPTHPRSYLSHI